MAELSEIFSKKNIAFLELLINESLSVRELAEKAGCSPGKASQAVSLFREKGLAETRKEKNRKMVFLDRGNALVKGIVSLLFVDKIVASKTFSELKERAEGIGLYGSAAEGTADKLSDIDLWVLAKEKPSMLEFGEYRNRLSRELGREVSLKAFSEEELNRIKEKDKVFFNELALKSRVLHGKGIA